MNIVYNRNKNGGVRMDALRKEEIYTIDDIYALPDGERAELIDGKIYYMAPPSRTHQQLLLSLSRKIADYIDSNSGDCEVNIAPFAVFLNEDDTNYLEPDISITRVLQIGLLKLFLLGINPWTILQSCLNIGQQMSESIGL